MEGNVREATGTITSLILSGVCFGVGFGLCFFILTSISHVYDPGCGNVHTSLYNAAIHRQLKMGADFEPLVKYPDFTTTFNALHWLSLIVIFTYGLPLLGYMLCDPYILVYGTMYIILGILISFALGIVSPSIFDYMSAVYVPYAQENVVLSKEENLRIMEKLFEDL